ncbi:hypothetical protein ILUMI_08523 [Ignelater luminosus]|uniref:Methionine aminopeptidase n=1 Tax=Ignelater luminosus TaxID=2038154 RepID=A0A8K0D5J2_IGNLU|nr:hypothetical protein ILUMI_08523 [Ignelater luminosus]
MAQIKKSIKLINQLSCNYSYFRNFWTKRRVDFGKYSIVKPGKVSAQKIVPAHINKPAYHETGIPITPPVLPEIKNEEQILRMRASCKLAANILNEVGKHIRVGQTTDEIDTLVHELTIKNGAYPSPLNYKLFPKSVCTSVNNVACHGIPDDRPLENGDIINVDITVYLNGYHGDCSKTFLVGDVDDQGCNLVKATENCLQEGISICKPGRDFSALGAIIQRKAKQQGFSIVPAFVGHGIGEYFHGPPDIFHFRNLYPGTMDAGMTFTIEPVLSQGGPIVEVLDDNWTAITTDNARTAQCEHTVLVTSNGVEILTLPD